MRCSWLIRLTLDRNILRAVTERVLTNSYGKHLEVSLSFFKKKETALRKAPWVNLQD